MTDRASNPKQEFNRLYSDVAGSLASATAELDRLDVEHTEGKQEIGSILGRLRDMQSRFDAELGMLEEHAEWEKFTIAFFGETNAGKSTIIDSLRILFKEESRQKLLQQNADDLARFEEEMAGHADRVRQGLLQAHAAYAAELEAARRDLDTQTRTLLDESAARNATVRREVGVLERALQEESSVRKQLEGALAEAGRKVWLAAAAGCVFGGAVLGAISLVAK